MTCFLDGYSEKEAAQKLGLSKHTVHTYARKLHRALGVATRAELLARFVSRPDRPELPQQAPVAAPPVPVNESEQVYFCVNLLERRGYMVKWAVAAEEFLGKRRRGLVAAAAVVLLSLMGVTISMMDMPRGAASRDLAAQAMEETRMLSPAPITKQEYPRRLTYLPPLNGRWEGVTQVNMWETITWRAEGDAEVRVDRRELPEQDQAHVLDVPGTLYVRTPGGKGARVDVIIDRVRTAAR